MYRKFSLLLMLVLLSPIFQSTVSAQSGLGFDVMTICIDKAKHSVKVKGVSLHFFDDELESLVYQTEGMRTHNLRASADGIYVDDKLFDTGKLRIKSTQNWLDYNGKVFRSDMLAIKDPEDSNKLILVNEIQLEHYLYGLINKECIASWPLEAKMAQAVAARTYALHKKMYHKKPVCDLGSTELDQVYGGFLAEDSTARQAVDITRGEVLVYKNQFIKAYYSSTCGGQTASSKSIWKDEQPYLISKPCPYCKKSPARNWTYKISKQKLAKRLEIPKRYRQNFFFDIVSRDDSGRAGTVRITYGDKAYRLSGEKFRSKIGYGKLKSTLFSFNIKGQTVTFKGHGLGHGVGMCQWGSANMAKQGMDYRSILLFYYPNTKIRRIY